MLFSSLLLHPAHQNRTPMSQIQLAVAQTVAAIPTYTPYPTPRIFPTATPMSLSGLFCEYEFCIGHPVSIAFFDLDAQHNPYAQSSITQGMLAAYDPSLFIQVIWQDATGASDASFMLDTIIDSKVDSRSGDLKAFQLKWSQCGLRPDHNYRYIFFAIWRRSRLDVWRARLCVESLHASS